MIRDPTPMPTCADAANDDAFVPSRTTLQQLPSEIVECVLHRLPDGYRTLARRVCWLWRDLAPSDATDPIVAHARDGHVGALRWLMHDLHSRHPRARACADACPRP